MHRRNRYHDNKPDFGELAEFRPSLKPFLILKRKKQLVNADPSPTSTHLSPPPSTPSHPPSAPSLSSQLPSISPHPPSTPSISPHPPSTPSISLHPHSSTPSLSSHPPSTPSLSPHPHSSTPSLSSHPPSAPSLSSHPSSTHPPSTPSLSSHPPSLYPYTINFGNPSALKELTCALLERDFGLCLEVPVDKLIPTVPLRLNYIHWIEDLLSCFDRKGNGKGMGSVSKGEEVIGIDIGTGTSCIYPLLGAITNRWRFLATEIDGDSVKYAVNNVRRNQLEGLITVKQVVPDVVLLGAVDPSQHYDFCMCNPPFFKDKAEKLGAGARSSHRPSAGTYSTGGERETVTEGGEEGFVARMVEDSVQLGTSVRWYSSMLGKKASVKVVMKHLNKLKVPVITTTEFMQGKTWRWGIAWSFDETLKEKAELLKREARAEKRPTPLEMEVHLASLPEPASQQGFLSTTLCWLQNELELLMIESKVTERCESQVELLCIAQKNTWSHQRRKRRILMRAERKPLHQTVAAQPTIETTSNSSSRAAAADSIPKHSVETQTISTKDEGQQISPDSPNAPDLPGKPDNTAYQLAMEEIESLYTPCDVEFSCSIAVGKHESAVVRSPGSSKRRKSEAVRVTEEEELSTAWLSFQWVKGRDRDTPNQIVQYLKNKLKRGYD